MFNIKVLIFVLSAVALAAAQNWCTIGQCSPGTHIACNHNGQFASSCNSPQAVILTIAQRNLILSTHNSLRNQIALGGLSRFQTARRMAQIQWDTTLAGHAELNTRQCQMSHDSCRSTPTFFYAGQNLGILWTSGTSSIEAFINSTISSWWNEHPFATMNDINRLTSVVDSQGRVFGHFTAMAVERTTRIGCGISTFRTFMNNSWWNSYLLACNYASTNMLNFPIYRTGTPASNCSLGADPVYPGLCRTNEPINPNDFS